MDFNTHDWKTRRGLRARRFLVEDLEEIQKRGRTSMLLVSHSFKTGNPVHTDRSTIEGGVFLFKKTLFFGSR